MEKYHKQLLNFYSTYYDSSTYGTRLIALLRMFYINQLFPNPSADTGDRLLRRFRDDFFYICSTSSLLNKLLIDMDDLERGDILYDFFFKFRETCISSIIYQNEKVDIKDIILDDPINKFLRYGILDVNEEINFADLANIMDRSPIFILSRIENYKEFFEMIDTSMELLHKDLLKYYQTYFNRIYVPRVPRSYYRALDNISDFYVYDLDYNQKFFYFIKEFLKPKKLNDGGGPSGDFFNPATPSKSPIGRRYPGYRYIDYYSFSYKAGSRGVVFP
jgi:hypothetical protein